MANYSQINSIGIGPFFPIELTTPLDDEGNPETVINDQGETVPKVGWYNLRGDMLLIKQNLITILNFQIGQRLRQEYFGVRTWECLEEPNVSALNLMIREFVKRGIASWEPRIKALRVSMAAPTKEAIRLLIQFSVDSSQSVEELDFQYNLSNLTTYVNE